MMFSRLLLILIFTSGFGAQALDCRAVMVKPDGVKRFFSHVIESAERFKTSNKMSTFGWLKAWLREQEIRRDDLDLLEGCLAKKPGIKVENCANALDTTSLQLFTMIQDTKDARDCEFVKMPAEDQKVIRSMIDKAEQFHYRLLEKFHDIDWQRAMQNAAGESQLDIPRED